MDSFPLSSEAAVTAIQQYVPQAAGPILSGCLAFGSTLAVSTICQKVILGISTGTKVVPTLVGITTVCLASLASQQLAVSNHVWMQQHVYDRKRNPQAVPTSLRLRRTNDDSLTLFGGRVQIPHHHIRV